MEVLVELTGLGWCWGIVGDTLAASPETKVEAEEAEGPSGGDLGAMLGVKLWNRKFRLGAHYQSVVSSGLGWSQLLLDFRSWHPSCPRTGRLSP